MKLRNDFVTNSSSSSFVIAYKGFSDATLDKLLNGLLSCGDYAADTKPACCCDSEDNVRREIGRYFTGWYHLEDNFEENLYMRAKQHLDCGYSIAFKDVGLHNDLANAVIKLLEEDDSHFVVIGKEQH